MERNPLYSLPALVIIGGLISSTLLTRVVTPVLYKLLAPKILSDKNGGTANLENNHKANEFAGFTV